jgi:hypothetical protein
MKNDFLFGNYLTYLTSFCIVTRICATAEKAKKNPSLKFQPLLKPIPPAVVLPHKIREAVIFN